MGGGGVGGGRGGGGGGDGSVYRQHGYIIQKGGPCFLTMRFVPTSDS